MPLIDDQGDQPDKGNIARYYDIAAEKYFEQYRRENLAQGKKYAQNYYRLQLIIQRLATLRSRSVYEVGTGDGTPLALMARMGYSVAGCDISEKMVELTRQRLKEMDIGEGCVQWGDIEDSLTIANQLRAGCFDAVIALGVMPHVGKDLLALKNMRMFLDVGGSIFVEFRNKLLSLFSFNRYTKEFILDDLLADVADDIKTVVARELDARLDLDHPPRRQSYDGEMSYDDIKAKFHNPFEMGELFAKAAFTDLRFHWYHYHPAIPKLEHEIKERFWEEARRLEHTSSWRGYFLCSAFVVEAKAI